MSELFKKRVKEYFGEESETYLELLNKPSQHGFFVNTTKGNKEKLLKMVDFEYQPSFFHPDSYFHYNDSIGKTIAYELGLIYPQDIESSLFINYLDSFNPKIVVDMCASPGGKSIDIYNRFQGAYLISNEVTSSRVQALSSNLERMGFDYCSITSKKCDDLAKEMKGNVDLVLLDAPCSGEGMIRKYKEIFDTYNLSNIKKLAVLQKQLLNNAYEMLNDSGAIVYSTCTYAFEEDDDQIKEFLDSHPDMKLYPIHYGNNRSKMDGTIKLSPLNGTEGQFIAILVKNSPSEKRKLNYLKTVQNRIVDDFIKENLNIDKYYLYQNKENFYFCLHPLIDLKNGMIRSGIYLGSLVNNRFEPSHCFYRANVLLDKFKYKYELNENQYLDYVKGLEIKAELEKHYYLLSYNGYSLGFGKSSNGVIKNKYPKGLRRL